MRPYCRAAWRKIIASCSALLHSCTTLYAPPPPRSPTRPAPTPTSPQMAAEAAPPFLGADGEMEAEVEILSATSSPSRAKAAAETEVAEVAAPPFLVG